jgi:valyl-tRNA synthetase
MVRDELNRKMSKSLGNVADPLDLIDKYGTDAVRFTFATSSTPGQDFSLQPTRLESARNFGNKLWNITRFVIGKLGDQQPEERGAVTAALSDYTLADRWILSRFNRLCGDVDRLMRAFNIGEAGRQIETFLWDDFADWYVELAKVQLEGDEQRQNLTRGVLFTVLKGALELLHPTMPFVTELAWQHLVGDSASDGQLRTIMYAAYPQASKSLIDDEVEASWGIVQEIIRGIRNIRTESGVEPARWIEALISAGPRQAVIESQRPIISRLARVAADKLTIAEQIDPRPEQAATIVAGTTEVYLPLAGMVDLAEERKRLEKELEKADADIARRRAKLDNEGFVSRAPANVVQRERDGLAEAEATAERLRARVASLS